jgi:hypothetical protein
MPRVGFDPTIPVSERAKKFHALQCAATVIGSSYIWIINSYSVTKASQSSSNASAVQFDGPWFKTAHFGNLEFISKSPLSWHPNFTFTIHQPQVYTKPDLCIPPSFHFWRSFYGTTQFFILSCSILLHCINLTAFCFYVVYVQLRLPFTRRFTLLTQHVSA